MEKFSIQLPNGTIIEDIPRDVDKGTIMRKAIEKGAATPADFGMAEGEFELGEEALANGLVPPSPVETAQQGYSMMQEMMGQYMDQYAPSIGGMAAPQQVDPNAMVASNEQVRERNPYDSPDEWKPHITVAKETTSDPAFAQSEASFTDYFDNIWKGIEEDYDMRVGKFSESIERLAEGEQDVVQTAVQLGGQGAGAVLNATGEVIIEGVSALGDGISLLMPDYAEGVIKQGAKDSWEWLVNTDAGQAAVTKLGEGMEAYQEWALENPQDAANVEAIVNISALFTPVPKGTKIKPTQSVQTKLATAADDLLKPAMKRKENAKNIKVLNTFTDTEHTADLYKRTGKDGITRLTPMEDKAVRVLPTVKGYKMSNTSSAQRHNTRVLNDEIKAETERLTAKMAESTAKVNDYDLYKGLQTDFEAIIKSNARPEEVTKQAAQLGKDVQDLIKANGLSPAGVWKTRQMMDDLRNDLVKKAGMGGWNDAGPEAQLFKAVRDRLNASLDAAVPGTAKSLDRLSGMKYVLEPLSKEAAKKAGTLFTNIAGDVGKIIGAQRDWAFAIGSLAGGALGYSVLGPVVGGGVLASYAGYNAYRMVKYGVSSETRKALLGKTLQGIDNAMKMATMQGQKEVAKALRANRAALIEMVDDGVKRWEEGGKEQFETDMQKDALLEFK